MDDVISDKRFPGAGRLAAYAILISFALFYMGPLIVVVLNSVRSLTEITHASLIGWPQGFEIGNYAKAWSGYCIADACVGIQPYMINSLVMVVPATIVSTLLGALNGFSLSLWRFPGARVVFTVLTLGVFLPDQMKLVPWVVVLRELGLFDSVWGLILIHVIQGICFTTLFCRNYYANVPIDLIKAAKGLVAISSG